MKQTFLKLFLVLFLLCPILLCAESDNYLEKLERELSQEEQFLENIIKELISKGDQEFIETLIYKMGYEKAQEKVPRFFGLAQFGGGPMASGGIGIHIFNRQFFTYLSGGYTSYGKYKNYSVSFVNEVRLFDVYYYKRNRIDFLLGGNISYFSEPGSFISAITFKQNFYFHGWFFNPYTVINFYFDKNKGKNELIYQIGIGINLFPWG